MRLEKYLSMQLLYANQAAWNLRVWGFLSWSRSLLFACLSCCQCMFSAQVSLLHRLGVTVSPFLSGFSPRSSLPCSGIGMFLLHPSLDCWMPPSPVALCWQELGLGPSPAPTWVVSKPQEWLGSDGDMQCSFMMDQINSETISSISHLCSSFYKASIFCPKSRYF